MPLRLGIVGDVHLAFDEVDAAQLDALRYDAILFVGDLAGYSHRGGLQVAREIARLKTPTYVIPGNHDAAHVGGLAAEILQAEPLIPLMEWGHDRRADELEQALGAAHLVGFSRHLLGEGDDTLALIGARPHSAGGPHLAFRPFLEARFGVGTLTQSAERVMGLIEGSPVDRILILAHNGPAGLGKRRDDPWGCDFRKEQGDFGDPDLSEAIAHALALGKQVVAVVAGHMHHALRGGGERRWRQEAEGVLYVNAARVPRIFTRAERELRHHVCLEIDGDGTTRAEEVLLTGPFPSR